MNENSEYDKEEGSEIIEETTTETATETVAETRAAVKETSFKKELYEWVSSIVIALVIALILRNFVFTLVKVDGSSMVPTLHNGERLVVVRLMYKPANGDIIIFMPPNRKDPFVKRVIGMPGQEVIIENSTGKVYVDGKLLDEPYINNKTVSQTERFKVPEGHVFVMGDNRGNSHDSRASDIGFIPYSSIMGKAVFRLWPFNVVGTLYK